MAINTYFENIADAIRAKTGDSSTITPANMPSAIGAISSGTEVMTIEQWNALTPSEKRSLGFVGVISDSNKYQCGTLYNGALYPQYEDYLPNSNSENIICFCTYENFDNEVLTWGDGVTPLVMSEYVDQYQSEEAVYLNSLGGSKKFSIPLPSTKSDFTLYCVAKGVAYRSGDVIILGSVNSWSSMNEIMLYHRSGTLWRDSVYGNDHDLIDTQDDYVAVALRSSTSSNSIYASFFAYGGSNRTEVPYNNHGTEFTFGSYGTGNYSTDLSVKFIGMVSEADSDVDVTANLSNLATKFNLTQSN